MTRQLLELPWKKKRSLGTTSYQKKQLRFSLQQGQPFVRLPPWPGRTRNCGKWSHRRAPCWCLKECPTTTTTTNTSLTATRLRPRAHVRALLSLVCGEQGPEVGGLLMFVCPPASGGHGCPSREVLKVGVALMSAAMFFPLLAWGGYVFLPFDAPLLDGAPLRLVYTLRCSVFAAAPIVLGEYKPTTTISSSRRVCVCVCDCGLPHLWLRLAGPGCLPAQVRRDPPSL